MNIGERVGAVCSMDENKIELFGYGIYEGHKIPDNDNVKAFGKSLKEMGLLNPCILLDSGEKVWGCECWWGSELKVKEMEKERKEVITICPNENRNNGK